VIDVIHADAAVNSAKFDSVAKFDSLSPRPLDKAGRGPPGRGDASEDSGSQTVPLRSSSETAPPPESEEVEPEARGGRGGEDERQLVGGAPPPVAAADTSPSAGSGRTPTRRCIT